MRRLDTIERNIIKLLNRQPELRNKPHNYLIAKYWQQIDQVPVNVDVVNKLTSMESITRARRKIIEKYPKYAPDDPDYIRSKSDSESAYMEYSRN